MRITQRTDEERAERAESVDAPVKRPRVVMLMYWIPHYRAGIFRRLSQSPYFDFEVWAGEDSSKPKGQRVASAADVGNAEGIRWRRVPSRRIQGPIFRDYEWQPGAIRLAWREDVDLLLILGTKSVSNWLVRVICKLRRIPFAEWSHGVSKPIRGLKWTIRKAYMSLADAHLIYSKFACDFFAARGFPKERLFQINNSLDHERQVELRSSITPAMIQETRRQFGATQPDDRLIFHSGRLMASKKIDLLIDALGRLKHRPIRLVLIGDGDQENVLRDQGRRLGIDDRMTFYGSCYDEGKLARIFSAADLCVVPGAIGLTAMHSLVYGTPVLTTDNSDWRHGPEFEAVVEGSTGAFFRSDNLDDLVAKLESMLYPRSCREKMKDACMEMIDTCYTPRYQEGVIHRLINTLLCPAKRVPDHSLSNDAVASPRRHAAAP